MWRRYERLKLVSGKSKFVCFVVHASLKKADREGNVPCELRVLCVVPALPLHEVIHLVPPALPPNQFNPSVFSPDRIGSWEAHTEPIICMNLVDDPPTVLTSAVDRLVKVTSWPMFRF